MIYVPIEHKYFDQVTLFGISTVVATKENIHTHTHT